MGSRKPLSEEHKRKISEALRRRHAQNPAGSSAGRGRQAGAKRQVRLSDALPSSSLAKLRDARTGGLASGRGMRDADVDRLVRQGLLARGEARGGMRPVRLTPQGVKVLSEIDG